MKLYLLSISIMFELSFPEVNMVGYAMNQGVKVKWISWKVKNLESIGNVNKFPLYLVMDTQLHLGGWHSIYFFSIRTVLQHNVAVL